MLYNLFFKILFQKIDIALNKAILVLAILLLIIVFSIFMDDFVLIIVVTVVVIDVFIGIDVTDTFTDFIIAINFNGCH